MSEKLHYSININRNFVLPIWICNRNDLVMAIIVEISLYNVNCDENYIIREIFHILHFNEM